MAGIDRFRRAAAVCAILACAGCSAPALVRDTGYTGTWKRSNDRNVSIVAIVRDDQGYRFRWTKRSFEGKFTVLCDWDGRCEERLNGEVVATHRFTPRFHPETGQLEIDAREERRIPVEQTFDYTDVLEVADHGLTLWSYTVFRDGQRYEGDARPRRSFEKVCDGVAFPPKARSAP